MSKTSVIIPTYTGVDHIERCIHSVVQQSVRPNEILIFIDGPNPKLRNKVDSIVDGLETSRLRFKVHQGEQNQGRFMARYQAAQIAAGPRLVFVDDRVEITPNYLATITKSSTVVGMANVVENGPTNLVSNVTQQVRRKFYGKHSGYGAGSFYLTNKNFEKHPKGTTSFWIPRDMFLSACEKILEKEVQNPNISDDTKLLRLIVERYSKIYRDSKAVVHYFPRTGLASSIRHLYQRGPKFVDYYLRRGTRFFWPLVLVSGLGLGGLVAVVVYPPAIGTILVICLIMLVAATYWLSEGLGQFVRLIVGVPIVIAIFGMGVTKGLIIKVVR